MEVLEFDQETETNKNNSTEVRPYVKSLLINIIYPESLL